MCRAIIYVLATSLFFISQSLAGQSSGDAIPNHTLNFPFGGGGSSVSLVYKGYLFKDPATGEFPSIAQMPVGMRDDEARFISKVIDVNLRGDQSGILSLWKKDERKKIEKVMENAQAFSRNLAFFRNIMSTKLLGVVAYKNASLIFVEHNLKGVGPYRKMYPAILEDGSLFLTNSLVGDVFYERLAPVLMKYFQYSR